MAKIGPYFRPYFRTGARLAKIGPYFRPYFRTGSWESKAGRGGVSIKVNR
jgi:hypothetical protein